MKSKKGRVAGHGFFLLADWQVALNRFARTGVRLTSDAKDRLVSLTVESPGMRQSSKTSATRTARRFTLSASVLGLSIIVGGCATAPQDTRNDRYDAYWSCASQAIRPLVANLRIPAREAAMRAQAQCNPSYNAYRDSQMVFVQSRVSRTDQEMAGRLGEQAALNRRRSVTRSLTDYVLQTRRGG